MAILRAEERRVYVVAAAPVCSIEVAGKSACSVNSDPGLYLALRYQLIAAFVPANGGA